MSRESGLAKNVRLGVRKKVSPGLVRLLRSGRAQSMPQLVSHQIEFFVVESRNPKAVARELADPGMTVSPAFP